MPTLQQWFDIYAESHQNPSNKRIHWVCVPLIFYSIIGLLSEIPSATLQVALPDSLQPYAHWGALVIIIGLIFYFKHSINMGIGILIFSVLCLQMVVWMRALPMAVWQSSLLIFVTAWIGQFYGHKLEGKKPSFFQDLQFLLIGPAWLMSFIYQKLGIKY